MNNNNLISCLSQKNISVAVEGQNSEHLFTTNSSESIQTIGDNISNDLKEKRSKRLPQCSLGNNGEATTASSNKQNGKYLDDEEFRRKIKATLSNYIGKNCTLEQVLIRIRDDEKRGYTARVKIKDVQEIKVSEFLNGSFCKDNKIFRFTLMTDDGKNSISCDVNESGIRYYKVQNGPSVIMMINWYVGEKKCTIEIELGVNSFKIINLNGVTDKELAENKEVRIGDRPREGSKDNAKSLVEATTASSNKQNGKYLDDEEFRRKIRATLSNYIGKNCTLEQVLIRIRDDEKKGYTARVKIKDVQEIKVNEFLNESFCKDNKIFRFTLMTDDGKNSISCDVNESGIRYYKVQNGPSVMMTINWYVGKKKCTIEIELGVNSFKIINLNGVTDKELAENKEVRIRDRPREGSKDNAKSLVEAVQSARPKSKSFEQISLATHSGQQVIGPSKKKKKDVVSMLFESAKEHGAEVLESKDKSGKKKLNFAGNGYRLRVTDTDHEAASGPSKDSEQPKDVTLRMWKTGFTVDGGPLRLYDDPANHEFLDSVRRGQVPMELVKSARGGEVYINMEDQRHEDFVQEKPRTVAFTGSGHTLGSPAPTVTGQVTDTGTPGGTSGRIVTGTEILHPLKKLRENN